MYSAKEKFYFTKFSSPTCTIYEYVFCEWRYNIHVRFVHLLKVLVLFRPCDNRSGWLSVTIEWINCYRLRGIERVPSG